MTPAEQCWTVVSGPQAVLAAVETRLMAGGAVVELRQFYGLSAQEVDVLLRLEREDPYPVCASGGPQGRRDGVAA